MINLFRCIKSDFYKLKRTPILCIHVFIPLLGAVLFLLYYSFGAKGNIASICGYLETLAIVFPLLIGLITGMVIEQEEQVGNFQMLLGSTKCKGVTYISKLILLFLLGSFSVIIAIGIFAIGFKKMDAIFYVQEAITLFVANIILYIVHVLISIKLGKGASIGLGIGGTLLSALMLTGLGDRVWQWIPWAFGVRFCDYTMLKIIDPSIYNIVSIEVNKGIFIMILEICIALIGSLLWFKYWEGRKSYE
ncbi:lantibiotic immunity ABC transporter MutG family permease subunit [Clostridium botulinum]|nr:lantibiotic immunity ABC transporter MutG family permease subunit [Clostridium botulinum]